MSERNDSPTMHISVSLPQSIFERLLDYAFDEGLSVDVLVERALVEYLDFIEHCDVTSRALVRSLIVEDNAFASREPSP